MISTAEEQDAEKAWARSRKHVAMRYDADSKIIQALCKDMKDRVEEWNKYDKPDSFEAALHVSERKRLDIYALSYLGQVVDLRQDPLFCLHSVWSEHLDCLIKGQSFTWVPHLRRWFTTLKLFTAMGWPITDDHVSASGSVASAFSRSNSSRAPESRTRHTMHQQTGNGMHVNSIGAVIFAILLRCPGILDIANEKPKRRLSFKGPASSKKPSSTPTSSDHDLAAASSLTLSTAPPSLFGGAANASEFGRDLARMRRLRAHTSGDPVTTLDLNICQKGK